MPVHPVCDLFPMMAGSDLEALEADISLNGLIHPIVVHGGQLVDGRHRVLACRAARVQPIFVEWQEIYHGDRPLARWIWSVNAERRHLTLDQVLAVEVAVKAWEEIEAARQRQQSSAPGPGRGHKKVQTNSSEPFARPKPAPQVRTKLAKQLNVSERKAGELLTEMPKAKGAAGNPGGQGASIVQSPEVTAQTLSGLGISKRQSSQWQKLAAIPAILSPATPGA
jgi:ParB-like nuclease domain